jgi:hypothetical protein
MPPRGLRPKLSRDQLHDLAQLHHGNLDMMMRPGFASPSLLWELMASALTWSRAAELSGLGVTEMTAQLQLMEAVATRYRTTGKVGFSGPQYQQAKEGAAVMDALAEAVDLHIAQAAADWSEQRIRERTMHEPAHHLPGYKPAAHPTEASTPCP